MQNRLLMATLAAAAIGGLLLFIAHRFVSKEKMGRLYRRGAYSLAALAVLGLSGEIATRLIYPEVDLEGKDWAFLRQFSNPPIIYEHNSLGFRDREIAERPAEGVVRIAAMGDSVTEGDGVNMGDRVSDLLQDRLNASGSSFEVVNFGVTGDEYPQHMATLRTVLDKAHPDFILLQWFMNDLEGANKKDRPRYLHLLPSTKIRKFMKTNSVLYNVALKEWRELQVDLGLTESYWSYLDTRFKDQNGADYRRAEQELETILGMARDAQVPIAMVLYPEFLPDVGPDYPVGYLMDRVLATCGKYAVACIDLRPLFDGSMPMSEIVVSKVNDHPSRRLNERTTDAILEALGPTLQALHSAPGTPLKAADRRTTAAPGATVVKN